MARAIQHHSLTDSLTTRPPAMTRTVAAACSQALCCVFSIVAMPRTANFTLRSRPVNVSGFNGVRSMRRKFAHRTTQPVGHLHIGLSVSPRLRPSSPQLTRGFTRGGSDSERPLQFHFAHLNHWLSVRVIRNVTDDRLRVRFPR